MYVLSMGMRTGDEAMIESIEQELSKMATEMAFRYWMHFGERCTEGFLSNVNDLPAAEMFT